MSIETDIKQAKFNSEYQKASINIIYTANWLSEKIKVILEPEGITQQQFNILRILRGSKTPLSTLQIRSRMLDKMSDTSRLVDRLIIKKLASKKTSAIDKRLVEVVITEAGLILLKKIDEKQTTIDNVVSGLSIQDAEQLNILLDKIRNLL